MFYSLTFKLFSPCVLVKTISGFIYLISLMRSCWTPSILIILSSSSYMLHISLLNFLSVFACLSVCTICRVCHWPLFFTPCGHLFTYSNSQVLLIPAFRLSMKLFHWLTFFCWLWLIFSVCSSYCYCSLPILKILRFVTVPWKMINFNLVVS